MRAHIAALGLLLTGPAQAHDFWLQPLRFQVAPRVALPITVQVGHGAARQRWARGIDRVVTLASIGPGGRVDLRGGFRPGDPQADFSPTFARTGLHVVMMQTTFATSELPAIRFNDYLRTEGLTPALQARADAGRTDAPGREIYSRRAKALVVVGPASRRAEPLATRPLGLSLEIVPERDPYALRADRTLPVYVLFEGRRLPGATVKLTSLEFDAKPLETAVTDADGRATFRVPAVGEWLLNVVWTKTLVGDPRAEFETTFSSLTFGYSPSRR